MKLKKFFLGFLLGLWICGGVVPESGARTRAGGDAWRVQLQKFAAIYAAIQQHYPAPLHEEKLFFASISGFLKQLDPHSYFLDPLMVRSLSEDQQGNYYGIGTRITRYEDRLTVIEPMAGMPAARMGILAGDVIAEIEGRDTRSMTVDDAMKLLRGARGTRVDIKIRREGMPTLIPFLIERAEIPLNSVSYALPLPQAPEIAYIGLRTFGNTTVREIKTHLDGWQKEQRLKALVLDLRGNAGGSLYAAVDLADLFLEKGKTIVSVRGRTFNRVFAAQQNGQYETLPLVVLINRGSASASEILAAAMQDHQRAQIIGSRSWGKGLVQSVSQLSLNCSMALTTAKYYTPNNKCLQRDYQQLDDYLLLANTHQYDTDTSVGGGVFPDILSSPETYPELLVKFISRGTFFAFARYFLEKNPGITRDFQVDDTVMANFGEFLDAQKFLYDPKDLKQHASRLKKEIKREVLAARFSQEEAIKIILNSDPAVLNAVEVLKKKYKQ